MTVHSKEGIQNFRTTHKTKAWHLEERGWAGQEKELFATRLGKCGAGAGGTDEARLFFGSRPTGNKR